MFVPIEIQNSLFDRKELLGRRFMWMEWFQWHAFIKNMKIKSWHTYNWFYVSSKDTNVSFVASHSCSHGTEFGWDNTSHASCSCGSSNSREYSLQLRSTMLLPFSHIFQMGWYIISMLLDLVSVYVSNTELSFGWNMSSCFPHLSYTMHREKA